MWSHDNLSDWIKYQTKGANSHQNKGSNSNRNEGSSSSKKTVIKKTEVDHKNSNNKAGKSSQIETLNENDLDRAIPQFLQNKVKINEDDEENSDVSSDDGEDDIENAKGKDRIVGNGRKSDEEKKEGERIEMPGVDLMKSKIHPRMKDIAKWSLMCASG
jgi:hypothetical protein